MSKKPIQVLFAGAAGCGKSPVANHLSWKFNLPRMENDALRNEVRGDLMGELSDPNVLAEYKKRLHERYAELNRLGWSFVDDCSIDRTWFNKEEWFDSKRTPFIISFDLSYDFIAERYARGKQHQIAHLEKWVDDHQKFLDAYTNEVNVRITEKNYADRIRLCDEALKDFIKSN